MVSDFVLLDFENAEVRSSDFESLKPEGWLTGEIINFYWTFLERREFCTEPSVLFLGTYTAYRISNAENAAVTDNISMQLSEELKHRQLILIPLNHRSHWSLLVYCRLTRTFYHYDSISKHNRSFAEHAAGKFLRVLEPKLKEGFYFKSMQTPQQNNDHDCGIYVLAIAEELARRFINNKRRKAEAVQNKSTRRPLRERRPVEREYAAHGSASDSKATHQRYRDTYEKYSSARDFSQDNERNRTLKPSMVAAHSQQQQYSQRRNQSTPPVARISAGAPAPSPFSTAVPRRALASDLLMPKFAQPFSGFQSPFTAMYGHSAGEFNTPEPLLKGGGCDALESQIETLNVQETLVGGGSRSREERLKLEAEMMEKAGLPRDFWLVTVEDIEYPHCMRRRIRSLVVELQQQQKQRHGKRSH